MTKKKFNVIDLFAGAGGLSEGFKQAGFHILAANEIDPVFSETFIKNNPETKMFTGDIRNVSVEEFRKQCGINGEKVDVIVGGPPCQGFSIAGRRDPKDPRNSLFMEFIRFVDGFRPKFFVMENVTGILSMKTASEEHVKDIIIHEFEKIGYNVNAKKVIAADYGVPQKRRRVFFIGTNTGKKINFPEPTHSERPHLTINGKEIKPWVSVGSVLLPKEKVPKQYFHTPRMIEGFIKRKARNLNNGHGFGWQIINPEKPSYTISARYWKDGSDALVKYSDNEVRMLTELETARIQTFPDNYMFTGSKRLVYTQIGNAVPVKLANVVAEEIKRNLD